MVENMRSYQSAHIGQIMVLLTMAIAVLWFGDGFNWFAVPRAYIEEKILRISVHHVSSTDEEFMRAKASVAALEHEKALLTEENESLRKQLQAPLPATMSFIPAYTIDITRKRDMQLRLAAGQLDGIQTDMLVVSEAILIGRIVQTTPRIAHVRLLASAESKIAVMTKSGARGVLIGGGEAVQVAVLDRVLQQDVITSGDSIVTSGEDGMPVNILIGTVDHVISEAREPFQRAAVTLLLDPSKLNRVFVVDDK